MLGDQIDVLAVTSADRPLVGVIDNPTSLATSIQRNCGADPTSSAVEGFMYRSIFSGFNIVNSSYAPGLVQQENSAAI